MDMEHLFEAALAISKPWFVKSINFDSQSKRLDLMIDFTKGSRFTIKEEESSSTPYPVHDTQEKEWRHLNFFEHECYLRARVPRVKLPDGSVRLIEPPWSGLQNGFTLLFEALVLQLSKHMPVNQVAKLIHSSDHKVWSILDKYVDNARADENYSEVTQLGMDETSIAKGHDYITLFVDLKKKRTLFVTEGKGSATVTAFKKDFEAHAGETSAITDISCDMSPAFIKGVTETLPKAKITFDKFHILKLINEAVDQVRRDESKDNPLLKGTRFIFLKNEKNLTPSQRDKKESLVLSELNLKSLEALNLRETFQQIYHAQSQEQFELLLNEWYEWAVRSQLSPMEKVAKTIMNHWDGIVQWKTSQINNGILEGLNSIVQAAKRKARGYKAKHFKTIVYLITGGLDFSKLNPACLPT
jgi:transposase